MFCHCWIFLEFFFSFLLEITFIQEGAPRKSYKHENLCITVPIGGQSGKQYDTGIPSRQCTGWRRFETGSRRPEAQKELRLCARHWEKRQKYRFVVQKSEVFRKKKKRLVAATQVWHGFPKVWASARRQTERWWNWILSAIPKHFRGSLCLCDNINRESESAKSTSTDDSRKSPLCELGGRAMFQVFISCPRVEPLVDPTQ